MLIDEFAVPIPVTGQLDGEYVPIDFVALCEGLGARTVRARTREELVRAIEAMKKADRTTAVVVEVDKEMRVPGYESWWDVAVAEVSESESVRASRAGSLSKLYVQKPGYPAANDKDFHSYGHSRLGAMENDVNAGKEIYA